MTTTHSDSDFSLVGLRVRIHYNDPNGILDPFTQEGSVLGQSGTLISVETDPDEHGDTTITLALIDEVEVIVPTVLLGDDTDPPADRPLIDPDAIDGIYRLEF